MWRSVGGIVALLAGYFAVPVRSGSDVGWRVALTALAIGVAGWFIVQEVRHIIRNREAPLRGLALALVTGVLVFALADYVIAFTIPGQFVDLNTRVDALYFALTTLATVGYGDVHAQGQLARALVSLQLVFNLVVIATAASIFANAVRRRRASPSEQ